MDHQQTSPLPNRISHCTSHASSADQSLAYRGFSLYKPWIISRPVPCLTRFLNVQAMDHQQTSPLPNGVSQCRSHGSSADQSLV
ncbi:hypothetical protein RRG08_008264 [Elysia crispata]|uniref:Uncharacterized protein n=1 Tax=Elysia crispata TaxID=231223 RepID=A0AAE0ZNC7_9GAST|nr:hypothetical protein RRG08_008264 [Elysia crispata]